MIKGQWMILFFKILLTIIIVVIFTCSIILFRNYVVKINYNKIENYIKNKRYFINLNNYLNSIGIYKKYLQYLIIILSLIFSIIIYFISFKIFNVISTSILISIFSFFIPYNLITRIYYKRKEKIIKLFPTYIITLKTYTQLTNDIIIAFRNAKTIEPLKTYIDRFNIYVEKGINVFDSLELLKKDIDIKQISDFLSSIQVCYINGGNFNILLNRYAKLLLKSNLQKEKEEQEIFSSITVLIILIVINLMLLFLFVFSDSEYKAIITTTFTGKLILNINILSYIFIYFIIKKFSRKGV